MITIKTLYEIKNDFRQIYCEEWEWAFSNTHTENDKSLGSYDDDDEFYTDGVHYIAVDEIGESVTWQDAWTWAIEENELDNMIDYFKSDFEKAIKSCVGFSIETSEVNEGYRQFAIDNADNFLEWKWKGVNNA